MHTILSLCFISFHLEGPADLRPFQVLQFLQHDGYVETARAFAEEIQAERQSLAFGNEAASAIMIKDDHDATTRQRKMPFRKSMFWVED